MSVLPVLAVLAAVVLAPVLLALAVGAVLAVDGRVEARQVVDAALGREHLAEPPLLRRRLRALPPAAAQPGVAAVRLRPADRSP
jgi:hypothetical protein